MKLFNIKTQQFEPFQPFSDQVTLCATVGRQPVEEMQLSHLFPYCAIDVLVRYFEISGLRVKYALTVDALYSQGLKSFKRWAEHLKRVMLTLNIRPPDYFYEAAGDSGMVARYLGRNIDIRVEGATSYPVEDLVAPDQAKASGNQMAEARIRLEVATVDRERPFTNNSPEDPMTVEDMLRRFSANAIRLYLAQQHYRSPWTFDQILLEKAAQYAERLSAAMSAISTGDQPINIVPVQNRFNAALDNDLDTAKGIATLLNLADEILFRASNDYLVDDAQVALSQMASVFGLRLDKELTEGRATFDWNEYQKQIELERGSTVVG